MADIKKLIDSFKGMKDDEAIDKVARMVKSGEAGITATQAITLAKQVMPMMDKANQQKVQKLISKLK